MRIFRAAILALCVFAAIPAVRAIASELPAKGSTKTAQWRTIEINGTMRDYLIQAPEGDGPFPVIVLLHGGTQTDEDVWDQTSLPVLAAAQNFIVVAPQAVNNQWNDGRTKTISGHSSTADDLGFLHELIGNVVGSDKGDKDAVFLVGASNGGFMTMHYACNHAEDLRAAASVIADLPVAELQSCKPAKPLPWLAMNGMRDPLIPFAGQAEGVIKRGRPQPALLSADKTFAFWADNAKCKPDIATEKFATANDPKDTAQRRTRKDCAGGNVSVQYVFENAGHTWPGMRMNFVSWLLGGATESVDSGTVIWDFFNATIKKK